MNREERKARLIDEELERMEEVRVRLGDKSVKDIGWGKTLEEKFPQFEKLRKGWVMTKENGEEWTKVAKVKVYTIEGKKKGKTYINRRGRIQVSCPPEWEGYTAKNILSKKVTPTFVEHTNIKEVSLEDLVDRDPSNFAEIVDVPNDAKSKDKPAKNETLIEKIM